MSPSASGQESQLNTGSKVVLCPNHGFQQASTPPPCPKNGLCDQSSLTPTSNWPNCSPLPKIDRGLYLNMFQPFTSWHLINHLSSTSRNTGPPHKDQTWGQSTLVPQPWQELQWTEYWRLQDTTLEEAWLHCSGGTVEMLPLRRQRWTQRAGEAGAELNCVPCHALLFSGGAGPFCSQDLCYLERKREYVGKVVGKVPYSLPAFAFVFLCCF